MEHWISLSGLFIMLFLAWLCSENRHKMDWRLIITGTLLQFVVALFLLRAPIGQRIFSWANLFFTKIIGFSHEGASFLFGREMVETTMAFSVLPTIIFVATLSAILYYLGVLQFLIRIIAWVMHRLLNISGVEAIAVTANVYAGMTEAPLLVKPYLPTATRSELMMIMTAGMATIAGGVMAAYINMGATAGHLLTASLMSAPAAIVIARMMVPETETSLTKGIILVTPEKKGYNLLDATCIGASEGLTLAMNVGVMLLAAISLIALLNWTLTIFPAVNGEEITLQRLLGWAFAPLAFVMGVPKQDILTVGTLLGEKTVLNEFVAYADLTSMARSGQLSERSFLIAQYALCGFANFGSIAVLLGGLGPLIPERRKELAQLAFRAMIGGTLAAFCTACVVGFLL